MPENNFKPSPYQALIDAGFSPDDARKAIFTITAEGYEMPYEGPRKAYILNNVAFQIFAHSAEHANQIFEESGIDDGPCEIHQDGHVLRIDYLNVQGTDPFAAADWNDYQAERNAERAGILPERGETNAES